MLLKYLLLAASTATVWARGAPWYPLADLSSLIAHDGSPVGTEEVHNGYNLYITKPPGHTKATKAVLYLTDVFGIQLAQNKLLADSFARAGFLTVAPDLFGGSPAPGDINVPGFNTTAFLAQHGPDKTDPIVAAALSYIQSLGIPRIGATGYCYGGRYAFRAAGTLGNTTANFDAVDAVFAAHPSLLSDDEINASKAPASIAAAETDSLMSVARRTEITALLQNSGNEYSFAVYGGTSHGFGVRANVTDPRQKFAKEEAFLQAARWFSVWL
ncbi:dienelactone hydrolase family protein [Ophiostoma piceae UAMH 11346]|uniref:Dienelactone hydrolase family protein n=1 Tax=Ophiostoma piceae (strain UAMH 11346) TaxID=1262450 RepID=S3CRW8_OPHP1|nr:dienelactone hydrolase family protein [Ophiostoma piceae UAMH 11346]